MKYKVIEIFDSIEGEGKRTGLAATFIRLAGCNLHCSYCDTEYALYQNNKPPQFTEMSLNDIMQCVNNQFKRITLTGGEPLIAANVTELINAFSANDFEVNIETNGAVDIAPFKESFTHLENVFFTIDYKLKSSGVFDKMIWRNFTTLTVKDVIKFVVGSKVDIDCMLSIMERLVKIYGDKMPNIYIGAVYGKFDNKDLVKIICNEKVLKDAHLQLQIHKIIWNENERGV